MALPLPHPYPPKKMVFKHAVFTSLYTYVRALHLWHTKTEKQLQDKPIVAKRPWQMQAQKRKPK